MFQTSAAQTLALSLGLGSLVLLISYRLRIPAVLPLLITGLALGRSGLGLIDASTLGDASNGGRGLQALITVSISLLIFEGSLHLDRTTLSNAPKAVWRVLTVGALVTWVGATLLARAVLDMSWHLSVTLGAILIVTGPTVIQPIIRRIPLTPRLNTVLASEGIIIDAIGAIATISTLEVALRLLNPEVPSPAANPALVVIGMAAFRLAGGGLIGAVIGLVFARLMRRASTRGRESEQHLHLLAMGGCMSSVGLAELLAHESGLAAATTCGLIIANARIIGGQELRRFKEEISSFLLAILFVLLASRFEVRQFAAIGPREVLFLAAIMLLLRPANIFISTVGSSLDLREKIFAGLFAPRGIVAASVTSFAAMEFARAGVPGAERLEAVIFLLIIVTAGLASITTRPLARALGVLAPPPNAVVIVGAHRLARDLASALLRLNIPVRLIDSNASRIAAAQAAGIPTALGDATDYRWMEEEGAPHDTGWVIAATGNRDVDAMIARWGVGRRDEDHVFRISDRPADPRPGRAILSTDIPLAAILADLDTHAAHVATWPAATPPGPDAIPVAAIRAGHVAILPANPDPTSIPHDATVIGIARGPQPVAPPSNGQDPARPIPASPN